MEISMENSREKCPYCKKKVKFLRKHVKRMHSSLENSGKNQGKFPENSRKKSMEKSKGKIPSFLKEINLQGEFTKMTDTISPKKDESKDPKFKCGACGKTFNEKYGRCPHCGVEFE